MADILGTILQRIFGSSSGRYVKRCSDMVAKANSLAAAYASLSDEQLRARTTELKARAEARKDEVFGPGGFAKLLVEMQDVPEERRKALKKQIVGGLNTVSESIIADAFAAVREACRRNWYPSWNPGKAPDGPPPGVKHFDVQLIGGRVLQEGKISEMATGEGKTLVATLPAYIHVVMGLKVHIVSTNDYLVKTGRDWVEPIFSALGVSVGAIQSDMDTVGAQRQGEYACDIVYGTNNEFGFDYLRDNMKVRREDQVQGSLQYVIIDEVDSILVDEARTPLIISGPARDDVNRYKLADRVARSLVAKQARAVADTQTRISGDLSALKSAAAKNGFMESRVDDAIKKFKQDTTWLTEEEAGLIGHTQFYLVERDRKAAHMTHVGVTAAQEEANIGSFYVGGNMEWPHLIENSLRAHVVYERDREYVVQNGEVIIVDEFTGRLMVGRQWSDGLHQAVEAKENVRVKEETQTLATITIQNYFKLYCKIAGMTGTAMTEAEEFMKIYNLDVVTIPTNRPINRLDHNDRIYRRVPEKYDAIVEEIKWVSTLGFPRDPELMEKLLKALREVYAELPNKSLATSKGFTGEKCRAIVDRIDACLKENCGDTFNVDELRDTLKELVSDLPGGRPVLVGTVSIENSEKLSQMLTRKYGIDHEVLNARHVAREAEIISLAGHRHASKTAKGMEGNVTISTNMAGRGTDIKLAPGVVHPPCIGDLGPKEPGIIATKCCIRCREYDGKCEHCFKPKIDPRFPEFGRKYCSIESPCGLHVVGTERHEARRIDNQLRGRAGRQGDPGSSRFFLSLEDDLLRFFAGEWMIKMLSRLGMEEGMAIESKHISKGIERAQKKVEERNFSIRKNLLEYDEVMDFQRQVFYRLRQRILENRDLASMVQDILSESVDSGVSNYLDEYYAHRCVSEWASDRLGVSIDPSRIDIDDFTDVVDRIQALAREEAENQITMTIGEYLDPDVERREWDLRGLNSWAMRTFDVSLSITAMQKADPEEIGKQMIEAAHQRIEKFDFEPLRRFVDPAFPRAALIEWARGRFGIDVRSDEIGEASVDEVSELLMSKIDEVYRQREIVVPVDIMLTVSLGQDNRVDSAYGWDYLLKWINGKYDAGWTLEQIQNRDVMDVRRELLALAESWLNGSKLEEHVDQAMRVHQGDALKTWAKSRFEIAGSDERIAASENVRATLIEIGRESLRRELTRLEQMVLLNMYDAAWKEHLLAMDHLKSAIGLRGYAEKDPRIEYKREGTQMFNRMLDTVRDQVSDVILKVQVSGGPSQSRSVYQQQQAHHAGASSAYAGATAPQQGGEPPADGLGKQGEGAMVKTIRRDQPKVGSNDPCPCGSGKKYKKCCGKPN